MSIQMSAIVNVECRQGSLQMSMELSKYIDLSSYRALKIVLKKSGKSKELAIAKF